MAHDNYPARWTCFPSPLLGRSAPIFQVQAPTYDGAYHYLGRLLSEDYPHWQWAIDSYRIREMV